MTFRHALQLENAALEKILAVLEDNKPASAADLRCKGINICTAVSIMHECCSASRHWTCPEAHSAVAARRSGSRCRASSC